MQQPTCSLQLLQRAAKAAATGGFAALVPSSSRPLASGQICSAASSSAATELASTYKGICTLAQSSAAELANASTSARALILGARSLRPFLPSTRSLSQAAGSKKLIGLQVLATGSFGRTLPYPAWSAGAKQAASTAGAPAGPAPQRSFARLLLSGRLGSAAVLHLNSFWQRHTTLVVAGASLASVLLTWRLLGAGASLFGLHSSESSLSHTLLGVSVALTAAVGSYMRWRGAISPDVVYRKAMLRLNTHPGVLEVMGAPLVGSEARAYVISGGGLYLSNTTLKPRLRSRRIQMVFPISGSERSGVVSLEARRTKGQYAWKLLAVDVLRAGALDPKKATSRTGSTGSAGSTSGTPANSGNVVFVEGDASAYAQGGVVMALRAPLNQALALRAAHDVEDEVEEEMQALRVRHSAAAAAAAGGGKPQPLLKLGLVSVPALPVGVTALASSIVNAPRDALQYLQRSLPGGGGGGGGGGNGGGQLVSNAPAAAAAAPADKAPATKVPAGTTTATAAPSIKPVLPGESDASKGAGQSKEEGQSNDDGQQQQQQAKSLWTFLTGASGSK